MSAEFFDSNVLIYMFDRTDDRKREISRRMVASAVATGDGVISFQVVQETLNVLTRRVATPVQPQDARRILHEILVPLWTVYPSQALYARCLDVRDRYQYSFYDSLIIAAALEAGCTRLYSEDLHDGQQIEGLTVINPFRI